MALFFVSSLMYSREAFLLIYYLSAKFCFLDLEGAGGEGGGRGDRDGEDM